MIIQRYDVELMLKERCFNTVCLMGVLLIMWLMIDRPSTFFQKENGYIVYAIPRLISNI